MDSIWIIVTIGVLGPIIGSLIGILFSPSQKFLYNMLAFAAGVMLSISFLELIPESIHLSSITICAIGVIFGAALMYIIDKAIPHFHPDIRREDRCNPKRSALYLIIGIFIHNIPEGMAMGIGSVTSFSVSLSIALAIAIHNIPEGICTSLPYYMCTKNRLKSFLVSSSTAIPILLGFLIAHYIYPAIPIGLVGFLIGATAGLMIYISADELIPASCSKVTNHSTIFSVMTGVIFVLLLGLIQ